MRKTLVAGLALLLVLAGGCGDAEEITEQVENKAEEVAGNLGAGGVAEALRVALLARRLGQDEHLRAVATLKDAAQDLPGDPNIEGIEDSDGDGRDDDGIVVVRVGDERTCLSIGADGEDVAVEDGPC